MPETVRIADLTSKIDGILEWQRSHDDRDDERFGGLRADVSGMSAKVGELFIQRAEQVGAAKAIAELADKRSKRNTLWLAVLVGIPSIIDFLSKHHVFGL